MKITILKQGIRDTLALEKGIQEVKDALASINFPVEIIERNTTKVFTTELFSNAVIGQGACIVPEQILEEVDGSEDIVFFIFTNVFLNPKPLNPLQSPIRKGNATVCQMCEEWYADYDNVFESFFLHEMCHAMYYLTNQVQNDLTHFQGQNPQYQNKSNIEYYLYLIKQLTSYWNAYKAISHVILTRHTDDGIQTLGDLQVGNSFSRATLERPWLNNQKNISCIPKGIYDVLWTFSPRLLRYTYEVTHVTSRSGIRIHKGNFFFDVDGCILLGTGYQDINHDGHLDVINSTVTIKSFEDLMQRKPFKLEIR